MKKQKKVGVGNFRNYSLSKIKNIVKDIDNIPKRLIIFLILIFILNWIYGNYSNVKFNIGENQYFWILGSYTQGFSTFVGILIASLTLATNKIFIKKIDIKQLDRLLIMPIVTSLFTIFLSIIGMVFYSFFNKIFLGLIIFNVSAIALWCVFEIFNLILMLVLENKK